MCFFSKANIQYASRKIKKIQHMQEMVAHGRAVLGVFKFSQVV